MMSFAVIPIAHAAVDMTAFGKVLSPIISQVVYPLITFLFALAIAVFVYGIIQFIIHGADPAAREKGQKTILYGTIGLVIMISAWGIVYLVANTVKGI